MDTDVLDELILGFDDLTLLCLDCSIFDEEAVLGRETLKIQNIILNGMFTRKRYETMQNFDTSKRPLGVI